MTPELWSEIEHIAGEAIELPEGEQKKFVAAACAGRAELLERVENLLAAHRSAGEFLKTPAFAAERWMGRRIGCYRLVEEIGRGGMGIVFRAERDDEQFQQQAAVKLIAGLIDAAGARRFLEERQILAALVHPNIARLLDGGVTEDGMPYMVMEYVAGTPITTYCDQNAAPARQRLELFRRVCLAVHYAHQHLVVHRDIKPANILVTADGTPMLLDFGIAKMLVPTGASGAETRTVARPMTPEYASPEQLRGGATTTATDVYSLGVLLYELLTGKRPYALSGATLEEAVRIVSETHPQRPSTLWRATGLEFSEDIDFVIAKAMRMEPQERYASARELADDVGRCVTGLPVLARRGTFGYVARRLAARHKGKVAVGAAFAALLGAATAAIGWEAHVANRERERAQRRFDQLHGLARSVIFELHDGIASLPGSTAARKLLVTRALAYLDTLASDASGDPTLQGELAEAYLRVGDAQGRWNGANLGDAEGALASYRKGLDAVSSVLVRQPRSDAAMREAGWLHLRAGEIYLEKKDAANARKQMEDGLNMLRARAEGPDPAGNKRSDVAAALIGLFLAERLQDLGRARAYLNESAALYEKVLSERPGDGNIQREIALAHRYLATYSGMDTAIRHLNRALDLDQSRADADPVNAQARMDVAIDLAEIGQRYMNAGKPQAALDYFRRSLLIREQLAAADRLNVNAQARLAYGHWALASALFDAGRPPEAAAGARKSAQMFAQLSQSSPADSLIKENAFAVQAFLGNIEQKLGHKETACAEYRRGLQLSSALPALGPADNWLKKARADIEAGLRGCGGLNSGREPLH